MDRLRPKFPRWWVFECTQVGQASRLTSNDIRSQAGRQRYIPEIQNQPAFSISNAKRGTQASAFTLLELLVAMAVLSLVMLVIVAITNGTASLTQGAQSRIGGNSELRTALDRLSADFDAALFRADLPIIPTIQSGNDTFEFPVSALGYTGDRPVSQVRYGISEEGLIREIQGFGWTDGKVPFGNSGSLIPEDSSNDVLGAGIFRLECQFLMGNGTYSSNPADFPKAHALVFSLATIDEQAMAKMNFTVSNLANLFSDSENNRPAFQNWSALLQSPAFVSQNPSIPPAILAGIQVAGRIIPLPRHH